MPDKPPSSGDDAALIAAAAQQVQAAMQQAMRGPTITPWRNLLDPSSQPGAGLMLSPDIIPGYSIVAERQRGGQGVVYEAFHHATRRRVAIKVLHATGPGSSSRARFEREVEILAQLRHPNIVGIHDSAQTGDRLYYVMDLVDGEPLDRWIARRDPGVACPPDVEPLSDPREAWTPDDTLGLFIKVCDALQAAHLRGVIHRDLKPANVLVDRSGEPHVLDFGLAKWAEGCEDATVTADLTQTGQFLGSLLWAAPEQLEGDQRDVDSRSDVYSLGVMLFQGLTGRMPYPIASAIAQTAQYIREHEPERPSRLRSELDDEIDTIVLKCLQKEPPRRYQTAGEVARDLQRYLNHEPIEAKRESTIYMLRKQLRRHRLAVGASAAVLAACGAGLAASLVFWHDADLQRARAEASSAAAAKSASETRRVAEFQATLLGRIDPEVMGRDVLDAIRRKRGDSAAVDDALRGVSMTDVARETLTHALLDPAEREIETQFSHQPEIEVRLRDTLAELYRNMGRYGESERHIRRAIELRSKMPEADLYHDMNRLGVILLESGKAAEAEVSLREALDYAERRYGPSSSETATVLDNLATLIAERGALDEAEAMLRRAHSIWTGLYGERHPDTLTSLNNLVALLLRSGRIDECEPIARQVLETRRATLGKDDVQIAVSLRNLARIQFTRGELDACEINLREALRIERVARGNDHPAVAGSLNALAMLLMARGSLDDAEALFREALASQRRLLGDAHAETLTTRGNLGALLVRRGDLPAAIAMLRETLAGWTALYGEDNADVARIAGQLAEALINAGDAASGEPLARRTLDFYVGRQVPGASIPRARVLLARALIELRRFDDARDELRAAESATDPASALGAEIRRRQTALEEASSQPVR